jgi:hypothetical protein
MKSRLNNLIRVLEKYGSFRQGSFRQAQRA